jgi:hypothetical protein
MPHESEPRFLVAHALRLKGFAERQTVAAITGLDGADVERHLRDLGGGGLASYREGRLSGWTLTPEGKAHHAEAVSAELDAAGVRPDVDDAYRRFLALNADMLAVCTAWQMRGDAMNDHSDAVYDKDVVDQLVGIHDRVRPVTADLRDRLCRYSPYGRRLRAALERILGGEHEWFTKPVIDSYHTVWFELHEDLLCTLGIDRGKEALDGSALR